MTTPYLLLFDCDGTLADSAQLIVSAMQAAFSENDLPPPTSNQVRSVIGLSLPIAIENLITHLEISSEEGGAAPQLVDNIALSYKQQFTQRRVNGAETEYLFEGAGDLIRAFADHPEFILGIATGKSMKGVESLLSQTKLEHCFHTIQTADVAPSKPHPAMIERALSETGIDKSRAIMIGDTTFDIEMAHNGGITAIGVSWGYHDTSDLEILNPHQIVHNFGELELAIFSHFNVRAGRHD